MKKKYYMVTAAGLLLLGIGFYLLKGVELTNEFLQAIPYVCQGLGCGIFGYGAAQLISEKALSSDPELKKHVEIEENDERNIAIANYAKSKAYDLMTFVFGALMFTFALMDADLVVIVLLVAAYLFVQGSAIYYRQKYEKEM